MNIWNVFKAALGIVIVSSIVVFFVYGSEYVSIEVIMAQRDTLLSLYEIYPLQTSIVFVFGYILLTAISFPGATLLTLLGGMLFGVIIGTVLALIASTVGATLAMLATRFIFPNYALDRFGGVIKIVSENIQKNGVEYLLALRLIPLFPFFLVNIAMAFTHIRVVQYMVVSMIGMFPGALVYVYAGSQLGTIDNIKDIVSPQVISALAIIGLFPIVLKYVIKRRGWDTLKNNNNL